MSSRSYLSIGDVLTLLREEFPDVTISKIRFLESQGLVNPERSPSGYRKFFDHDVERLRWVLRQQREHFLPLKVIRDRLADGNLDDGDEVLNGNAVSARAPEPVHATASGGAASRAQGGHTSASASESPTSAASYAAEQPTKADEEAMARIVADASRRTALLPEDAPGRRGLQVVGDAGSPGAVATTTSAAPHAAVPTVAPSTGTAGATETRAQAGRTDRTASHPSGAAAGRAGASRGGSGSGSGSGNGAPARASAAAADTPRAASGAGQRGSGGGQGGSRKGPAPVASAPVAETTAAVVTGASLTAEELSAASGLAVEEVAGLVSFGLIEPISVAGIETYDEDALTVANLAASFRAFGIEPRHLRLYRNAVDREIGLIEQVVIPLLRQRNPESRQRALDGADELGALGQSMRATLLKQALRRHLGG